MGCSSGIVTEIQRFSVNDGPGIRTLVFLKGCPMGCKWCSNPETQKAYPELGYSPSKCILCKTCVLVCPHNNITVRGKKIIIDRVECRRCFECQLACPTGALRRFGRKMTVEEVVEEVEKDRIFYECSGGGLTLSGGECLTQPKFSIGVLKRAKEHGLSTAIETAGHVDTTQLLKAGKYTDHILYDIKHPCPEKHKKMTGQYNDLLLKNLARLVERGYHPIIRMPVIPGFNTDTQTLRAYVDIMKKNNLRLIHLLPLHHLGKDKYQQLDRGYCAKNLKRPSKEVMNLVKRFFIENQIDSIVGG